MSESPYAAPKSVVADAASPVEAIPRPRQADRACALLWIDVALYFPSVGLAMAREQNPAALTAEFIGYGLLLVFMLWTYYKVSRGRNWARVIFLLLTGFSLVSLPLSLMAPGNPMSGLEIGLSLAGIGLDIAAAWLLLTPASNAWFRNVKARA